MSKVGELVYGNDRDGSLGFIGRVRTLKFAAKFSSRTIDSANDRAPSHEIVAIVEGEPVQIGVAWCRSIKKEGDYMGEKMFSLSFDEPSLPAPINLTAFPRERTEKGNMRCDIVFQRPRARPAPKAAEGEDQAPGSGVPDLDDEIPF